MIRYRQHVGRIVAAHVPFDMVEEAVHETFVRAYTSLRTYSFRMPFSHWLATIAVRSCYDLWRSVLRRKEIPLSALTDAHRDWADRILAEQSDSHFDDLIRRRESAELLDWALAHLSVENRMVVTLVHLEGRPVREAAKLLGWSVANVKVRAYRARRQLRKVLEQLLRDPHEAI
jgi:RNA polymerase sigma-70 factor (ECF subfamily)